MRKNYPIIFLISLCLSSSAFALSDSVGPNGSNALAVHQLGYTGVGVNIGLVTAGNPLETHSAFLDSNSVVHVVNHDASPVYNNHDTPFAGLVVSNGDVSHPNDIGVAPGAIAHCKQTSSNAQAALQELIVNQGCRIIVTGIDWSGSTANGQSQPTCMYDYYADTYDVVFANAAGNNGSSGVSVAGDAYNGITTGSLADPDPNVYTKVGNLSGVGPTVDSRRKPDVVAPSTNQIRPDEDGGWNETSNSGATSWAVPHTAGVAALLLDYVDNGPGVDAVTSHNVVIKAAIVNSAFPNMDSKSGNSTNPADPNNLWHSERGYGRIDAFRALQTIAGDRVKPLDTVTAEKGWGYEPINESASHSYNFVGRKNDRLVFTVAWNREITKAGSIYLEKIPKMDIDVAISYSAGSLPFDNDRPDNLEKFDIVLPKDDVYTIELTNMTSNENRAYGFAFELRPALDGDLNVNYTVDKQDLHLLVDKWLDSVLFEDDIYRDGTINFFDFAQMARYWWEIDAMYYNPD
ncbi:MAG: S8 family serine peptidase [Anaerohalosphaeraceae bacterium]|nr:S8 family serine peptidase [Anaerohalosphaeraceae bacterium]